MAGLGNGGRERAYEALRESEELHRATLSNISDAVFLADDAGAFTFVCPNVDVIFGYTPDEVREKGGLASLLGENLFEPAELAARGEIPNVERQVTTKSGEQRVVLIQIKKVSIQGGTVLVSCRDVTALKLAEKALAQTRVDLGHAARLALVGELTATVVHEIRQPLTVILANAAVGTRMVPGEGELREIFHDMTSAAKDAVEIVERLQGLVRKRPLDVQVLDVNRVAEDVLHLLAADAHRRHVVLSAELAPALPAVSADRLSMQQVLLNLIVNAMDAVGENEEARRQVVVRTRCEADNVEIAVSDTGRGIAPDLLPRVFEAFFTTKNDGIGLGLAISRSIVEAHAGRIWAEDLAGCGAAFRLTLPIRGRPGAGVAALAFRSGLAANEQGGTFHGSSP